MAGEQKKFISSAGMRYFNSVCSESSGSVVKDRLYFLSLISGLMWHAVIGVC